MFPTPDGVELSPDELFAGRYAVDGRLPWGGLASYYRANVEGSAVVLCVLPMDVRRSERAAQSFARLAQSLGALRCPAVPKVLDAAVAQGVPYLALEDTRGLVLSSAIEARQLGSQALLRVASNVLDALSAAHSKGLVHADLTPQNVILTRRSGEELSSRLLGLGIAPLLRAHPEASVSKQNTGSGQHSVAYMPPELFGSRSFHHEADLYSVGVLLHHMVTGAPPTIWDSSPDFSDIPGLPDVIRKAMARQPANRYPDARAMAAALEWLEIESAKRNPSTQDIAPWMESSRVGSVPVPSLASSLPPPTVRSHPTGKVLTGSGPHALPEPTGAGPREDSSTWEVSSVAPLVIEEVDPYRNKRIAQIGALIGVLLTLFALGLWLQ
jgi:serine/threonine protein kinase